MTDESTFAAFIDRAYQDARELLVEMRDYVTEQSSLANAAADKAADPAERLLLTQVLSRATRQLTEVTAWLMVQKAVAAGEITAAEAAETEAAALPADDLEERDSSDRNAVLPLAARGMIDRSQRLYNQVVRLDTGRRAVGAG
jgi:regulator of CtrA degradation